MILIVRSTNSISSMQPAQPAEESSVGSAGQPAINSPSAFWVILASLVVTMCTAVVLIWRGLQAPPALDRILVLAREKQFDRAQELMTRYLRAHPDDGHAHLLMAQFAMDRPDPQPREALEHLALIPGGTALERAIILFSKGKAYYQEKRYDLAEACWKQALDLDMTVPEAGWALLDLLDFEGRTAEAHQLALRLYQVEPNSQDRVRLLLELIRMDIDKAAPGSQVQVFEPVVRQVPGHIPLAITVGLALIHDSRSEEGLTFLNSALHRFPESADAWDAWLTGLDDAFRPDQLMEEFARLPKALAGDPRFSKHEGAAAQSARDHSKAVAAYRRALAFEPFNGVVLYRFRMALRAAGSSAEHDAVNERLTTYQTAFKQIRGVYEEARSTRALGLQPHNTLYQHLAELREQLGRFDEAREWHRLVLRNTPDDAVSLAALERLK
jgi:tetratricopeptide (TPR) repeat protein